MEPDSNLLKSLIRQFPLADTRRRYELAKSLTNLNADQTLCEAILIDLVLSPHMVISQLAIEQLFSNPRYQDSRYIILQKLPHMPPRVVPYVIQIFAEYNFRPAIAPLIDLLQTPPHDAIRYTIINTLATLHASEAKPVLATFADHPNAYLRERARHALIKLST